MTKTNERAGTVVFTRYEYPFHGPFRIRRFRMNTWTGELIPVEGEEPAVDGDQLVDSARIAAELDRLYRDGGEDGADATLAGAEVSEGRLRRLLRRHLPPRSVESIIRQLADQPQDGHDLQMTDAEREEIEREMARRGLKR